MIRVSLLAGHPLERSGLETLARAAGLEVMGTASSRAEIEGPLPDLVLEASGDRLLLLAPATLAESGILRQDASAAELAAAAQAAVAGLLVAHPDFADSFANGDAPASARRPAGVLAEAVSEPLTPREIEVLQLVAEGASNKTIAWRLNISEHTVKFHLTSILGKLGAGSRTEAVVRGMRRGIVML